MERGKFIVLEGPDGAGSSTQINLLQNYFENSGYKVLVTKEPTNNLIGGLIRGLLSKVWEIDPYGLQLLFCADRAHHLKREIEPTLQKGWCVLTDRYAPSTVVYGSQALNNDHEYSSKGTDYWKLLMDMNLQFRIPDLTLILNLDPKECISRIYTNRHETEFFEHEEVLTKVLEGYRKFVTQYPNSFLIDASGKPGKVHSRIIKTIEDKLSL